MSMQTREQMLLDLAVKAHRDLIAQARAEGERAGIERAAKWHEDQAQQLRHEADETMGVGRSPDFQRLNLAERHTADAQALRALKVEGE